MSGWEGSAAIEQLRTLLSNLDFTIVYGACAVAVALVVFCWSRLRG